MSKQNEWCEHIKFDNVSSNPNKINNIYYLGELNRLFIPVDEEWNLCPMCGAKRPKNKELWEKLEIAFLDLSSLAIDTPFGPIKDQAQKEIFKKLEKIAEEHFKQEG